jgi:hypothetical protein
MNFRFDVDNDSMWEGFGKPAIFWCLLVVIAIITLAYLSQKYISCPAFGRAVDKPTFYSFWAGDCYVRLDDGTIVSQETYGGVNIENQ